MELVRLPSLLPLLALFSSEECRIGVVKRLLEKLTTVVDLVEDKVTIGTTCTHYYGPLTNLKSISHLFFVAKFAWVSSYFFFQSFSSDVLGSLAKTLAGSVSALTSPVRKISIIFH